MFSFGTPERIRWEGDIHQIVFVDIDPLSYVYSTVVFMVFIHREVFGVSYSCTMEINDASIYTPKYVILKSTSNG